jgi:hypothetical protein
MRYDGRRRRGSYGLGQGQVTGCCEFDDESKGLIKCGECIYHLPQY